MMPSDEEMRFSDNELILLQKKLDIHIEEFDRHSREEGERWNQMMTVQEQNTRAICELTQSTRGLIEAWEAANGTVKVVTAFGKFVKWLGSFAIVGAAVTWIMSHFKIG